MIEAGSRTDAAFVTPGTRTPWCYCRWRPCLAELSDLPETPDELEDYVAALFLSAGYFVEKNVTEPTRSRSTSSRPTMRRTHPT